MKSMIKITLIAAIAITAPAHAMFNHMGKAFRTAVMNRGFSTQPSMLARIHNGRRPLTTLGALIGLGSTGYAVQQARKQQQATAKYISWGSSDCFHDIAQTTYKALESKHNRAEYNAWLNERAKLFKKCRVQGLSAEEGRKWLYNHNATFAEDQARNCYFYVNLIEKEMNSPAGSHTTLKHLNDWKRVANLYQETGKKLRRDFQQEQDHYRRIDEMMPFWPA